MGGLKLYYAVAVVVVAAAAAARWMDGWMAPWLGIIKDISRRRKIGGKKSNAWRRRRLRRSRRRRRQQVASGANLKLVHSPDWRALL